MSLTALQGMVDDLVRDKDQVISSSTRDTVIAQAVLRYSSDRPRTLVVDVDGQGDRFLAMPAGWENEFSELREVEFPIGQWPKSELSLAEVQVAQSPSGYAIQLPLVVQPSQQVRLTYTQRHAIDMATDTVPEQDRYAVACWAASQLCGQLASYYATESAPTIAADVSDHQGKSERFRARARDLAAQYTAQLGIKASKTEAASTVVSMKGTDSQGGERIFHNRRYQR